jgi:peptidoglycan hydrolase-like protein with peptidoglycan-binding domain
VSTVAVGRARWRDQRRRTRMLAGAGVAVVATVAVLAAVGFGGTDRAAPASAGLPPATARVTRATLTQTDTVNGTLGYGDEHTISARAGLGLSSGSGSSGSGGSGSGGTITWLPAPGTVVTRGKPVYTVDERPVPLVYGTVPMYRVLTDGLTGDDVGQLEQNLAALGYTGFTVDETYTAATASAVQRWQADLGLPVTGAVDVNQVVVVPGQIRVAGLQASVGGQASGPVLSWTGTTRMVTVALDVAKQQEVHKGLSATVTLPDGSTVAGVVASIGTVATTTGSGNNAATTIPVTVTVGNQKALGTLDAAPVTVTLIARQRANVLTVPISALVALQEGGYGVQVVDGSTSHYVAVETGMFAGGRVEVTNAAVQAGQLVGVPK